jgi:hypothetical protein
MFLYKWSKELSIIHTQYSWPLRDIGPSNTSASRIPNWERLFQIEL